MPKGFIDPDMVRATGMLFLGQSRPEIDIATGVSGGSQDTILKILYNTIGEDNFKAVRELMQYGRKRDLTPPGVEIGWRIALKLVKAGINFGEFDQWLVEVFSESQRQKLSPQDVGKTLYLMWDLCQTSGVTPANVREELDRILGLIAAKKGELAELADKKTNDERDLEESMRKNNVTRAHLAEFVEQKEELERIGISVSNREKFVNVWKNVDEFGYSAEDAVKALSETKSTKRDLDDTKGELRQVKAEVEREKKNLAGLKTTIGNERAGYDEYMRLRSLGFDAPMLASIRKTTEGIMTVNRLDGRDASKKLSNDIATQYDAKVGFERTIEEHKKTIGNLAAEIADKKTQSDSVSKGLEKLQKEADEVRKYLDMLKGDAKTFLTDIQVNFRLSSGISKEMVDMLKERRKELSDTLHQTISTALPVESLAPISKAMSGERGVPILHVIASIQKVLELLESKMQQKRDLLWESIRNARRALHEGLTTPPAGYNPTT